MEKGWSSTFTGLFALFALLLGETAIEAASRRESGLERKLREHIEILASDAFEGREPGTDGETKTLRYLAREWFEIGLVSGTNDPGNEWFMPVSIVARSPVAWSASFNRRNRPVAFDSGSIFLVTSGKRSLVREAPLLFVGKGGIAGLSEVDLAGKIAVLLEGDRSDVERQNALLAAGASAVLTVLDGPRTLEEVAARRHRTVYTLADDGIGGDLEGFIAAEAFEQLLRPTSYSLDDLKQLAQEPGKAPLDLGLTGTLEATSSAIRIVSHNLIGKIPGKRPDAGAVLLVSHWDHFGHCAPKGAQDPTCNGAVDNASGIAALTEIARGLVRGRRYDRDIYFLASTAEEFGLLGAHAFAENPPVPLSKIVAAFNLDSVAIAPKGTPLAIVGKGMTPLDAGIAEVAKRNRRRIVAGDEANEYVKRQDGWALLQHDVPTVMVTSAYGKIDLMRKFFDTHYHRPSDDLSHELELGGAAEDVEFHDALVRWFADRAKFPTPVK